MSFNRRPDRGGPDRRRDRPDRPGGDRPGGDRPRRFDAPSGGRPSGGDWQPRERPAGDRGGPPGRDRPFTPRGDRPYTPRPRFESSDEGAMSIRLDPRRAGVLKQLAADAGTRPGELVRIWVEERLDAERRGQPAPGGAGAQDLSALIQSLSDRVAALERAAGGSSTSAADAQPEPAAEPETTDAAAPETGADPQAAGDEEASEPQSAAAKKSAPPKRSRKNAVSASPAERVALHDEMIAVIGERGPLPAAELAAIIIERGRYTPPRSGKPLDALTVNARVSNPTYRARFTRAGGRIGLAES